MKNQTDNSIEINSIEQQKLIEPTLEFIYWFIVVFDLDYAYTQISLVNLLNESSEPFLQRTTKLENWENGNKLLESFYNLISNEETKMLFIKYSDLNKSLELQEFISKYSRKKTLL